MLRMVAALAAGLLLLAVPAGAQEKGKKKSKGKDALMTDAEFDKLHGLLKPQPSEIKWMEIPWMINPTEAREKAAKEGKPLLIWGLNNGHALGKS